MILSLLRRHQREQLIFPTLLKLLNKKVLPHQDLFIHSERYSTLTFGTREYVLPNKPFYIGRIPESIKITSAAHTINKPFVSEVKNAHLAGSIAVGFDEAGNIIGETTLPPNGDLRHRYQGSISLESLFINKLSRLETDQLDIACSLVSAWSKSYYHWFLDYLTRLEGLEYYQSQTGLKPLLIIDANPTSWQRESLKMLGYNPDDCTQWNQEKVNINRLVVPSFRQPGNWVSPSALHWLRQRFFNNLSIIDINPTLFSKRVYISRSQASGRKVMNEDEVMQTLAPYGFVSYSLEAMSFAEQVQLFSSAEIIIGPHGAGFTNIIFSHQKPTIVEFVTPWVSPHYYLISNILGFPYWCIECHQNYSQNFRQTRGDMMVDIRNLNSLLEKINS